MCSENMNYGQLSLTYESRGGSSDFRLPTSDFRLSTSNFRLPTSVAMKGDGRPARLLRYAKMVLVPKTFFFSFCWVDYALEGSC